MEISLVKADMDDCQLIHEMQAKSYQELLDKYQDFDTNPGAEPLERIEWRMALDIVDHYFICFGSKKVGSLRVVKLDNDVFRLGSIFILPKYQGNGYAKQAILKAEKLYLNAKKWALTTIKQEAKLRHLYESLGYVATGQEEQIHDGMIIVYYQKEL